MGKQLVNCKACDNQIAKGVKKCPSCGKDQRGFFRRHKILTAVGGLVVLIAVGSAMGGGETEPASTTASNEPKTEAKAEKAEKAYAINDTISLKKTDVTVTNFEERSEVGVSGASKQASDGGILIAIEYTIKNVTEEPLSAFSIPSINLVNEKGTKFDSDIDATVNYGMETDVDNSKVLSDLNPDITVTDVKVFEVSKEKFDSGKWFILVDGKEKVALQ